MDTRSTLAHTVNPEAEKGRQEFYGRAETQNLAPLWRVLGALVTDEPVTPVKATMWKYGEVRPYLMEACKIITAAEAERRVMMLENPGLPGQSRITHSLFAGLQVILPGEVAPAHRHAAAALRFIVEGSNAYTAVAGERTMMSPGDFVITPSWTWHDHGNEGDGPMVWLDGLDMHLVNLCEACFREGTDSDDAQEATRPEGDSLARYGNNLLPVDDDYDRPTSPVFNYPYERTREALEQMRKRDEWSRWHGLKLKYANPKTGDFAIPTMATFIQLLPNGFKSAPYRSTDSTVFVCTEGSGKTVIGDQTLTWGPRDIFVVPSWQKHIHEASTDAVLFSYSDRAVQEKLGFWREQRFQA